MASNIIRTVRVYKRATGTKVKRSGHFSTAEVSRSEMDICRKCFLQTNCSINLQFHFQECAIACDYFEANEVWNDPWHDKPLSERND